MSQIYQIFRGGDFLCEMRFYVPNMEEVEEKPEKEADENNDKEDQENSEDEVTPAKVFNELIVKHAGLGDSVGDMIASLQELQLLVPRGKYAFQMYQNYAKFHGKTHDYKIRYKDIMKMFQLKKVVNDKVIIMLQLGKPLNQGNTMHHFILMQVDDNLEEKIKINLTQDEIKKEYNGEIEQEMQGPLSILISRLFKTVGGIKKILIPGEFRSACDPKSEAIQCSVKVSEGLLYPMKNSLIFI